MTTLATIGLPVADSWTISVGGGWIALMLIGMALCFAAMFAFMWLMRGGRAWATCGEWWPQETPPVQSPDPAVSSPESEA